MIKQELMSSIYGAMDRIKNGVDIRVEADFQELIFGELYKQLPDSRIRWEFKVPGQYQSYRYLNKKPSKTCRVDIVVEKAGHSIVIELKLIQNFGREAVLDMHADIAKVERLVDSKNFSHGFSVQLVSTNLTSRLPSGPAKAGSYHELLGSHLQYDFYLRDNYDFRYEVFESGHAITVHEIARGI